MSENKSELIKKAEDEFWRLHNRGFGFSGNSGESRATAAIIAHFFDLKAGQLSLRDHCIETAIDEYKTDEESPLADGMDKRWLQQGIEFLIFLKEITEKVQIPNRFLRIMSERYLSLIKDSDVYTRVYNTIYDKE